MIRPRSLFAGPPAFFLTLCLTLYSQVGPVSAANLNPKVAIIKPNGDEKFVNPTQIQIVAQADDADGFVQSVELFTDLGSLGTVTLDPNAQYFVNPLQWTWTNPPAGDHKLVALATDNQGASAYSDSLVVSVRRDANPSPATLVFQSPSDEAVFTPPADVHIELEAVDPNGDIRHVEFYANDTLIGRSDQWTKDAVIPGNPRHHSLEWTNAPGGRYQLVAKALDTLGNTAVSKSLTVNIGPDLPVVSIQATTPQTREPAPNIRVEPGVFTVHRTGNISTDLKVSLFYDGSAKPGVDYVALPTEITIAAGTADYALIVQPIEDDQVEGLETVAAILVDSNSDPVPNQVIDPQNGAAKILIYDSTLSGGPLIDLTAPKDGSVFQAGDDIKVTATAIDPAGYIARVEFFDFDTSIGVSQIEFFRAPDPGTPIYHELVWKNPGVGKHQVTARAVDSSGKPIVSKSAQVEVQPGNTLPVVSIMAIDPIATEVPRLADVIDPAQFSISRNGDLTNDLVVFFSLHGTAELGIDYQSPGENVVIPAGQKDVTINIVPIANDVQENMETVAIRLEDSKGIRADYVVQPALSTAVGVIFDQIRPENGAVELALPDNGAEIQSGQTVTFKAAAYHLGINIGHVDFLVDDVIVGSSDLAFANDMSGGLAIHQFEWKTPTPGDHRIMARAKLMNGTTLNSKELKITVDGDAQLNASLKGIERQPDGNVRLRVAGPVNQPYIIEVSSDLVHWQALDPLTLSTGQVLIDDEGREKQKFYRTRTQ